jgi:hypothetical protein
MSHFQRPTPGASSSSSLSKTMMERTGSLRSPLRERKKTFRSLLSERKYSLRSMASPPIMERKESLISRLLERTDSLRSMVTPVVERAMSARNLIFAPKKSVTFGEIHNRIHRSLSRDNYSNEELDAAFYCRGDYDCMKKRRRSAENLLQRSAQDVTEEADDEDEDIDCVYGLLTEAEAGARSSLTTKSVAAVLMEQDMQQWNDDQTTDPDLLADIYIGFSALTQKEAHERALKLEVSIRCYIAPCRWSPALTKTSRKTSVGKPEHRGRPTFAKKLSSDPIPSAAPTQPVRESSFRWRAPKQPIRELSTVGKPAHRRPTSVKQLSDPIPSAAPIQPVRESSFRRWRAPKKQPSREPSTMGKPEHQRTTLTKPMSAPIPSAPPIQPVRESSFRWRAPKQPIREPSFKRRTRPWRR